MALGSSGRSSEFWTPLLHASGCRVKQTYGSEGLESLQMEEPEKTGSLQEDPEVGRHRGEPLCAGSG